jgi:hypothetical protein
MANLPICSRCPALEAEIVRLQEEEMAVCNCGNENCPTRHGIHLRPRATAPTPEAIPARVARARSAVGVFRDAARMGRVIEGRERDPLVMDIHWALDALEAEVARLTQEQESRGWRPIETAPKDGSAVLVYFPDIGVCEVLWSTQVFEDGFWSVSDNKFEDRPLRGWSTEPTHWMPVPDPPAALASLPQDET